MESSERTLKRRHILGGGLALGFASSVTPGLLNADPRPYGSVWTRTLKSGPYNLTGKFVQGGFAIGRAEPRQEIILDGTARGLTSAHGDFIIGFDRDAPSMARLSIGSGPIMDFEILRTPYDTQRIDGLPSDQVIPSDPALLERIAKERELKNTGFASREDAIWFTHPYQWPLRRFVNSGRFGNQRILNGEPKSPHYGFDMAAPEGTPVYAPQTARVALAEPDLHFEGGLILLDHGQGLISMYLHLSTLTVKAGDFVTMGQIIGQVGQKGRATGPHLCWRLKWRDRALDPSLWIASSAQ
ncbi:M23 family metallopeptidase [Asticcacaulis excentricus]|uniref:Peptidase M23 n=1 Tax=Asticcacaulis excentricus (strain ATCC 15261 / DSM 4724 / KCTC 12464 / NCIMB 9791 / VKM B-1370 / CB 48) TaxID=573065 RepID=E8RUK9_ASTEC|nr:M23 family metallopeptidase [Asticcacaulis excentricus]ADU15134.1 Peptidase M23 [Asticcacaulis excentricus CB 48]